VSRSVLAHRDFRLFFVGNLISSSGTWLQNVAQGVLVLQLTGRSVMVGVTQGATFVPVLLLALHGGRLADRFDRRRLLIWTQVLAAVATGVLAVLAAKGLASVGVLIAVAVVLGIQYAVAIPASQALIPSLVPPEELGPAVGVASVTYNLARASGPLLSTVAITLLGFGLAFGLNSLSFVALAVAVAMIRPRATTPRRETGSIREGVRFAWRTHQVRWLLLTITAISFATDPVFTLSPALAESVFHRTASDAGLLVAAFGGGAIVAAFTLSRYFRRAPAERIQVGMVSMGVLAGGLLLVAAVPSLSTAVAGLVAAGMGYLLAITTWTTGVQEAVSDDLRGRVMALWTLCFLGSRPIAAVIDGALADLWSPRIATAIMVAPLVAAGLLLVPRLRVESVPAPRPEPSPG